MRERWILPLACRTVRHVEYSFGTVSHINDFNFEEALGLFAGLNILPKKAFVADYSYRTQRHHQEQKSRVLCYANANLTRHDQAGELLRFVEFWHALAGQDPQWLYFDSQLVPYTELSRVNQRGIWFVTIRRRGAALLRRLQALPAQTWKQAVIDSGAATCR